MSGDSNDFFYILSVVTSITKQRNDQKTQKTLAGNGFGFPIH